MFVDCPQNDLFDWKISVISPKQVIIQYNFVKVLDENTDNALFSVLLLKTHLFNIYT